ncbi:MAG: hypothetical protein IMZ52_01935 [Actinobacteria bacterium]|nr:hypothetical protein [Actinomycetota bacterium]MBE3122660.1 hypothetical protein [Thermoplasmata archaeon]
MKSIRTFILCLAIILLIQSSVSSKEIHFWDLENTTDLKIIVFNESKAIFQEKMEISNNLNESVEINAWFPLTWPYDVNVTEYSVYPYQEWKKIPENIIEYVNASIVEEQYQMMGIVLPQNYLTSIKSYPLIPGILFEGKLEIGEKTGLGTRTSNPTGLISKINGTYSLYTEAVTEGRVNSITIKIPRKVNQFWFFSADLKTQNISPLFSEEPFDPEYKIYSWDKDFLMKHFEDLNRNLTANKMVINYSYVISPYEISIATVLFIGQGILWILVGIFIQRTIDRKFPAKEKNKSNNKRNKKK